jgi:glycerol-3-phosphate dehydrogenase
MFFLVPYLGKILAGTIHLPWPAGKPNTGPSGKNISDFLADLNKAVPDFDVTPSDVLRIFSGLLPAKAENSSKTLDRPVRSPHASSTQANQFLSVWGVKFTTACSAAEDT